MKLGTRTATWALILSCVPLLGMAAFTFYSARQTLHDTLAGQLLAAAESNLARLDEFVDSAAVDISTWSSLHIIQDVLTDDEEGDATRELVRLQLQYPQFAELQALNDRGVVVAATRSAALGLDLHDHPAYGTTRGGNAYRGTLAAAGGGDYAALTLAAPIHADYDHDTVVGGLIGSLDWDQIRERLRRTVLLGTDQSRDRRLILLDAGGALALYDSVGGDAATYAQLPQTPGVTAAEIDGIRYIIGTAILGATHHQHWIMHALLSRTVADASVLVLRDRFVLFGLIILLAAIGCGLAFARSLTRPVIALQAAAQRLADRDYDTPLPPPRGDEIGSLTASFAAMRAAIKAHELDRSESEQEIRRLAYFDQLTGLPNRVFLEDFLRNRLADASRHGSRIAVIYFDLDHFKRINDTLGHGAGDSLLEQAAERLRQSVRISDHITRNPMRTAAPAAASDADAVVRFGGDEFIIVLSDVSDAYSVARVARRLIEAFAVPFKLDSDELFVTCSMGIALYPEDGNDAGTLLRNADAAMYDAKQHGRNGYSYYLKEMNARARERLTLEGRLRHAIEHEHFELHYQPQIDLRNNQLIGLEALVRWADPENGLISPAEFIPLAEETGLIIPLGEWILRRACAQMQAWRNTPLDGMRVAVNLSLRQVKDKSFVRVVADTLSAHGLDASQLELELTESVLMEDSDGSSDILANLKALGVSLSIDDFGTGYSSLSYLKRFAINSLKIDRSFVSDIESDPNDQAIVTAIIAMAHTLNLKVIAEGVETRAQALLLRQFGCDQIQGYWVSRPLPSTEMLRLASAPIAVLDNLPPVATAAAVLTLLPPAAALVARGGGRVNAA